MRDSMRLAPDLTQEEEPPSLPEHPITMTVENPEKCAPLPVQSNQNTDAVMGDPVGVPQKSSVLVSQNQSVPIPVDREAKGPSSAVAAAPLPMLPGPSIQPQSEPQIVGINADEDGTESEGDVEMPIIDVGSDSEED